MDLQKYWNFQNEVKLEQIIAIVKTHSVFLFNLKSATTASEGI